MVDCNVFRSAASPGGHPATRISRECLDHRKPRLTAVGVRSPRQVSHLRGCRIHLVVDTTIDQLHNTYIATRNHMRDNLIRFKQRGHSGRKDHYSFSRRAYLRDLTLLS